ncbi:hypothetical protein S40293_10618 [Stachybotrys chartarum IBT 40293]|nr:hypothetical protein S40293_10618 [Stachybotrys chartarum IBT 40293]
MAADHNNSLRIPRARASRHSSARLLSEDYHQHRQVSAASSHALRSVDSRYSLSEQFAATRREYEFGDDDAASSVYERLTVASEAGEGWEEEAGGEWKSLGGRDGEEGYLVVTGTDEGVLEPSLQGDHYELLCLPRDLLLTQDQIRGSYHRLLALFLADALPAHLQPLAQRRLARIQHAFETLIDPGRRAAYDMDRGAHDEGHEGDRCYYADALRDALRRRAEQGLATFSEVNVWVDPGRAAGSSDGVQPLDVVVSHSVAVGFPRLRSFVQERLLRAARATGSKPGEGNAHPPSLELATPTLAISGGVYGLTRDLPITFVSTRQTPTFYSGLASRPRDIRLLGNRLLPILSVGLRQELRGSTAAAAPRWGSTALEIEATALPSPSLAARVSHGVNIVPGAGPTVFDAALHSAGPGSRRPLPRLTLAARHPLRHGAAFVRIDGGSWALFPAATCRHFSDFSKFGGDLLQDHVLRQAPPSVEVGFSTARDDGDAAARSGPSVESGLRNLDNDASLHPKGSWTLSASATVTSAAAYLRFSRDLVSARRSPRVEVELCADTLHQTYLALRNLWPVGRFAKAGLEVGVSQYSLHLSLYWSRLNQRLSVPVLLCPSTALCPSTVLCAGALPFAALAASQLVHAFIRRRPSKRNTTAPQTQASIAQHRSQADDMATILARGVDARQKRQMARGGLVIVSAKFGVQDEQRSWAGEEVADVTLAVAALVDKDGRLTIPRGLRKGFLPGFWDPAPGEEKVLHVRYSWKGMESVVETKGDDEVSLPP